MFPEMGIVTSSRHGSTEKFEEHNVKFQQFLVQHREKPPSVTGIFPSFNRPTLDSAGFLLVEFVHFLNLSGPKLERDSP